MALLRTLSGRRRRRGARSAPPVTTLAAPGGTRSHVQRHYLDDVPSLLPKDPLEDQRLNEQHHALYRTLSNHSLAPLAPERVRTILDVGTGTGIWAFEMRALFPHALIVGVDVSLASLPQPVPPTCLFVRANILEGLPFPDEQFTSIHQRLLVAAIPAHSWPTVVQELVRVTQPGGWIELLELSDVIQPAGPATRRLFDWLTGISRSLGFEMEVVRRLGELLQQAGCVDAVQQDIPAPVVAGADSRASCWRGTCSRRSSPWRHPSRDWVSRSPALMRRWRSWPASGMRAT
jgi:ubiquinone/menaquinone biosynthesis C-methylase UbiE